MGIARGKLTEFGLSVGVAALLLPATAFAQAAEPAAKPPDPAAEVEQEVGTDQAANKQVAPSDASKTIEQQLSQLMGKTGGLTSEEAARRAAATSLDVRSREAEVVAAQAERTRVLYNALPRVDLLARYTRLSPVGNQPLGPESGSLVATTEPAGPLPPGAQLIGIPASAFAFPEVLNQYLLQASVTVPLSDYLLSTGSAVEAASSNEQAARLNREAAKLEVAMRARLLYYEWVRTDLQVVVAAKSVEQAEASLRTARTAFAAGRVSKADVLNAESLLASAELRAESSRTQATLAEQRLRVSMHDSSERPYAIGEDLFAPQPKVRTQNFKSLIAEASRKRLDLKALDEASRSLGEQRSVAQVRGLPRLEAFGNAYYARPNQRFFAVQDEWRATWDLGVQLSWSPNDLGTSSADATSLDSERAKLAAQRSQLIDRIQQDVLDAYTSLREAEIGVVTAQRNLTAAEEAYRVQRLFYEHGRTTTLELLDSEARLLQARIELVNVKVAQHMARVALEHAVGRDVQLAAVR